MVAPKRIVARASSIGATWKVTRPDPWFGEVFSNVEYVRADIHEALQAENERLREDVANLVAERDALAGTLREIMKRIEPLTPIVYAMKEPSHD